MDLEKQLAQYAAYSMGDLSQKCELNIQNQKIKYVDFSKYDLSNSFFVGVEFDSCNFRGVFLSGSFFGGSSFQSCMFEDNTLKKADWNGVTFQQTTIKWLDAFRTSFMRDIFRKCIFQECKIGVKCSFSHSNLEDVLFDNCSFDRVFLDKAIFTNVRFRQCRFNETVLPKGFDQERATGNEEYCFSTAFDKK